VTSVIPTIVLMLEALDPLSPNVNSVRLMSPEITIKMYDSVRKLITGFQQSFLRSQFATLSIDEKLQIEFMPFKQGIRAKIIAKMTPARNAVPRFLTKYFVSYPTAANLAVTGSDD